MAMSDQYVPILPHQPYRLPCLEVRRHPQATASHAVTCQHCNRVLSIKSAEGVVTDDRGRGIGYLCKPCNDRRWAEYQGRDA